jgi:hypothetical protein
MPPAKWRIEAAFIGVLSCTPILLRKRLPVLNQSNLRFSNSSIVRHRRFRVKNAEDGRGNEPQSARKNRRCRTGY